MDRASRGNHEYQQLMGSTPEAALPDLRHTAPQLFETLVDYAFGGVLARAELSRQHRELATVAILAALGGAPAQLSRHARAALRHGIGAEELLALCEHVAVYAGFPRALNALTSLNEALAEIPIPTALHRIRLSDHETTVAQYGESGPPIILAHAVGLDWRMWEQVMAPLANGRRVFAYDLRAHGTAADAPIPHAMADLGQDLLELLDALNLPQAHAVGLSYGGGVVQAAAAQAPHRFASLALLATTDHPFDAFEGRAQAAEQQGIPAQLAPTLTRWFTPTALAENNWPVRYARERVLRNKVENWAASWRAFTKFEVKTQLATFQPPTLVLAGQADVSTPPALMREIATNIPNATYEELQATPHMQTLDQPTLVTAALDNFLPKRKV